MTVPNINQYINVGFHCFGCGTAFKQMSQEPHAARYSVCAGEKCKDLASHTYSKELQEVISGLVQEILCTAYNRKLFKAHYQMTALVEWLSKNKIVDLLMDKRYFFENKCIKLEISAKNKCTKASIEDLPNSVEALTYLSWVGTLLDNPQKSRSPIWIEVKQAHATFNVACSVPKKIAVKREIKYLKAASFFLFPQYKNLVSEAEANPALLNDPDFIERKDQIQKSILQETWDLTIQRFAGLKAREDSTGLNRD